MSFIWGCIVNGVLASAFVPDRLRPTLLRWGGLRVGRRVTVRDGVRITSRHLDVGDEAYINHDVTLNCSAPIRLGVRCALAPGVLVTTTSHDLDDPSRRQGTVRTLPVTIGDGAWVGARAVVLPGVTVGAGCVVAAGAVVTGDCEPHGLYGGVPARRLRDLPAGVVIPDPAQV